MDNNRISKKVICLTLISLIFLTISNGCVETPEVSPAMIEPGELSRHGWEQVGDIKYETHTEEIPDITNVTINTAIITYQDKEAAEEIAQQMWDLQKQYNINNRFEIPFIGSQLVTVRLTLPAGIELPTDIASDIINYQVENTLSQNNVDNFMKSETG